MKECWVAELGVIDYRSALDLQAHLVALRHQSEMPDTLLLLEHPHTYTVGRRINPSHLLISAEKMRRRGIDLLPTDRGGEITYHGPGQVVGYPIVKIGGIPGIRRFLNSLEEMLIMTAADFGIAANRLPGFPGIWCEQEKLAAIGLRVTGGITKHGFALNTSTDLSYFDGIVPCGIHDKGVTSISKLLGRKVPPHLTYKSIIASFGDIFGCKMVPVDGDSVREYALKANEGYKAHSSYAKQQQ